VLAPILLLICQTAAAEPEGVIAGTVVNASRESRPADAAPVVLQVYAEGQFVPFRETAADAQGKFRFQNLPVGGDYLYLVGASRDGVFHPGPRLQILADRPSADVALKVYDAVASPNPLVIRRQEILLCPEPGVLRVTESLLVENPTDKCFVGEGSEPVTLRLSIPPDFERTTFEQEFYGRRFSLAKGALVTGIPWPPGQREIRFTYVLRNSKNYYRWQRPLDLPCEQVRVGVRAANSEQVACNLPPGAAGASGEAVFESTGSILPAGQVLRVDLGALPLAFMTYARWAAVVTLALLVTTISLSLSLNLSATGSRAIGEAINEGLRRDSGRRSRG
jgi:hypothetical protein